MSDLRFDLSEQHGKGPASFERRIEAARLQEMVADCAVLTDPLTVTLSAWRQGAQAAYSGSVEGEWEMPCVRCLAPARLRYRATVEGEAPLAGEIFDASEGVRQALHLAMPLGPRCRPDCRGLCPRCGANRNEGPCGCQPPEFSDRRQDA
jgi:uncharacterized metal-binding protein YceD (DUF177 family)